jgi:hypothetical protein
MASLRVLATAAVAGILSLTAGAQIAASDAQPAPSAALSFTLDRQAGPSSVSRSSLAAVTWRGGRVTTSTGETVTVLVSNSLPAETPEKWAEFMVNLTHGPEITLATTRIATPLEVQQMCGANALGCYSRNQIIAPGEPTIDGDAGPDEVVRHEYGHHVALHRLNTPWEAIDWGPKNWASAANVCARVSKGDAFPGNDGRNYALNPGEAWAETYRLLDERKAGITTGTWSIVSRSFFPNDTALAAAERDVVSPWTTSRKVVQRRAFRTSAKAQVWWLRVETPLDGELSISATLPRKGLYDVALVAPNRRTVLRRARWTAQRVKSTATTVCGTRSLYVRVTQTRGAGRVTVSATLP